MSYIINPFVFATGAGLTTPEVEFDGRNLTGSDDDEIATWSDSSGNGRDATNTISTVAGPILKTSILNGNSIARWDGNVRGLIFSGNAVATSFTVIAVIKCTMGSGRVVLSESSNGDNSPVYIIQSNKQELRELGVSTMGPSTTALNTTDFYTVAVTFDDAGNAFVFYLNGSSDGSGSSSATFTSRFSRIGLKGGNTDRFQGDIAYVAYWNSVLSGTELTSRFATLQSVWGHY